MSWSVRYWPNICTLQGSVRGGIDGELTANWSSSSVLPDWLFFCILLSLALRSLDSTWVSPQVTASRMASWMNTYCSCMGHHNTTHILVLYGTPQYHTHTDPVQYHTHTGPVWGTILVQMGNAPIHNDIHTYIILEQPTHYTYSLFSKHVYNNVGGNRVGTYSVIITQGNVHTYFLCVWFMFVQSTGQKVHICRRCARALK